MTVFTLMSKNQNAECVTGTLSLTELQQLLQVLFQDVGLLTEDNTSRELNRSKLRRQGAKLLSDNGQDQTNDEVTALCSLYFDGHKEKITVQEKVGTKFYC
jgi:hypothetical protein